MTDYIRTPFALNGDQSVVPQTDGSGAVNFDQGYPIKYSQDPNTTGLSLDRSNMNYLFWLLSQAVQQYQQHGFPDFITTIQNGGVPFPYDKDAVVLFGGVLYQSLIVANTTTPPSANWVALDPYNQLIANASPIFTGNPICPNQPPLSNNTRLANTAYVDAANALNVKAVSTASQPWVRATKLYTFPHTLGVIPKSVQLVFVCTANDNGYVIGDVVIIPAGQAQQQGSADFGYQTKVTSANALLSIDTNHSLLIHEWNNQSNFNPADASWTMHYDLLG